MREKVTVDAQNLWYILKQFEKTIDDKSPFAEGDRAIIERMFNEIRKVYGVGHVKQH